MFCTNLGAGVARRWLILRAAHLGSLRFSGFRNRRPIRAVRVWTQSALAQEHRPRLCSPIIPQSSPTHLEIRRRWWRMFSRHFCRQFFANSPSKEESYLTPRQCRLAWEKRHPTRPRDEDDFLLDHFDEDDILYAIEHFTDYGDWSEEIRTTKDFRENIFEILEDVKPAGESCLSCRPTAASVPRDD